MRFNSDTYSVLTRSGTLTHNTKQSSPLVSKYLLIHARVNSSPRAFYSQHWLEWPLEHFDNKASFQTSRANISSKNTYTRTPVVPGLQGGSISSCSVYV
jgi:hypothetical protein